MSLDYTIDAAQQLVTISGEYASAEEWKEVMGRLVGDPRRRPGFAYLRDLRDATKPVDAAAVVRIIEVVRNAWPHLQPWRAAIVASNEIDPAAVAHALAGDHHMPLMAFTSYQQAMDWLRDR